MAADVTARRRGEIAGIVARVTSPRRTALVHPLQTFNEAGREPDVAGSGPAARIW